MLVVITEHGMINIRNSLTAYIMIDIRSLPWVYD